MRLSAVVETSMRVAESSGRLQKVARLADLLGQAPPEEIETVIAFLSGTPRQGRIGVGWAAIVEAREALAASEASLVVAEVDDTFGRIASLSGSGSSRARAEALRILFERATEAEQDFLVRLLFGELRQGALEGVLVEAVARASNIPARSRPPRGDAGRRARPGRTRRRSAKAKRRLQAFLIQPFQPRPADARRFGRRCWRRAGDDLGEASLEYKLDGARIQVHKAGDEVRVYSRNLRDVTRRGAGSRRGGARDRRRASSILDGEAIALAPTARRIRSR